MKLCCLLLCLSSCVYLGLAQFSFFPRRDDRVSPFNIPRTFLPNPNRLRESFNGHFNEQLTRPRSAITYDESQSQSDQGYYQNNFNKPVIFPKTYPKERPEERSDYIKIPADFHQNDQSNERIPNHEYIERPVSFAVEDNQVNSGNNNNNSSLNYAFNQAANYQENDQTQAQETDNTSYNENTSGSAANDFNSVTTQFPNLEDQTEAPKYENRFGSGETATLPTLPDAQTFDSRSVETCETEKNEIGSCIKLKECKSYVEPVSESKSQCGFDGDEPKVCCPRPGIPTAATTDPTATTVTTTTTPNPEAPTSGKAMDPEDFVTALPEPPVCGSTNASFGKVIGGSNAKLGDFPWMAYLGYMKKPDTNVYWVCGGSIVTSKHVLTAAHCYEPDVEEQFYKVRLGDLDLVRADDGATPIDIFIKRFIIHELYNPKSFTNDIAILVMQKDVSFTNLIRPICLPQSAELRSKTFESYRPLIAGWGEIESKGAIGTHLQTLQLPVLSNDYCKQAYSHHAELKIDESIICAGYKKGGKDSCRGDSGGPLMQPVDNVEAHTTHVFVIGVVSFGEDCARSGRPGTYTRVTHFMPWINKNVLGHE